MRPLISMILKPLGLGTYSWVGEVERGIKLISQYPEAAPLVWGGVRKKPLRKFPFSLLYSVRHNEIRLLAVAHQMRRPFYWRSRR